MTRQPVTWTNQQSKSETPLVSGILQRAAVRSVPENEVRSTEEVEPRNFRESRFHHDFSQVPVHTGTLPVIQPKLRIGSAGDKYEQEADKVAREVVQQKGGQLQRSQPQATGQAEALGDHINASGVNQENKSGLPDNLKAGIENLSGISMNDVKVHYNSSKPGQLQALAYTQGTDIHVGPGQEQHLPHEAWHVVQQMQGRVKPTMQAKGVEINDDEGLEYEADVMSAKAVAGSVTVYNRDSRPLQRMSSTQDSDQVNEGTRSFVGIKNLQQRSVIRSQTVASDVVQRNTFLNGLANNNQIDYQNISQAQVGSNEQKLYQAIVDVVEKNRRRQAVLQALEDEQLTYQVTTFVNQNWGGYMGSLTATNLNIRSSHSGGGIDPLLPQPAYEQNPVAGQGTVVSVARPAARNQGLVGLANWAHLKATTTKHTTDPDHPQFRGGQEQPQLLGQIIGLGQRLNASNKRVASYFEFHAESVHDDQGVKVLDGTRVVYDPFNVRYFVSEHYDAQYELVNVPHYTQHPEYQTLRGNIQQFLAGNTFRQASIDKQAAAIQKVIKLILDKITIGEY